MGDLPEQENLPPENSRPNVATRRRWDDPPPVEFGPEGSLAGGFSALVVGAGVINLLAMPLMRASDAPDRAGAVLAAIVAGVILGEVGVLTLWLVWGPGSFLRRLVVHWLAGLGLFLALAIGFVIASAGGPPAEAIFEVLGTALCSLPLISLAAQLPLWPLRTYFGWRIEPAISDQPDDVPQPLAIRDLLLATVVTAVSLACLRLTPRDAGQPDQMFWLEWCVGVLSIAGISTASLIPILVFTLRSYDTTAAITWLGGYIVLAVFIVVAALAASFGRMLPAEVYFVFAMTVSSCVGALAIPLLMVRARGYRLTFPPGRRRSRFV